MVGLLRGSASTYMIWYDMIWWTILTCAQKLTCSQLSLPHGNQTKKNNEETKNIKRRCSEETVQSWSPWSQSWGWKTDDQPVVMFEIALLRYVCVQRWWNLARLCPYMNVRHFRLKVRRRAEVVATFRFWARPVQLRYLSGWVIMISCDSGCGR